MIIKFFLLIQIIFIILYFFHFIYKHFIIKEVDLFKRYGKDSWVLITGCSSGQGKLLAIEFAKRKFNIILIGRKRIIDTANIIKKYKVKTKCFIVDFSKAYKESFFNPIDNFVKKINLSILINNVGQRTAWNPYDRMPSQLINDTIICGSIVQARLTQIALQCFKNRTSKSAIINITAQCMYQNFWFGKTGEISVPYLSVYEAANAFGYYHSQSIQKEYPHIDILNITPGAVVTENTKFLENTPFSIDSQTFVNNIIKLLGNYNGSNCAYWGHDISNILSNFMFTYKDSILKKVGLTISKSFMDNYKN